MGKKRIPIKDMLYFEFGEILIETQDLDPVYTMLVDAKLEENVLRRWLLAYWCYYDAGVASYIAEKPSHEFYLGMWRALTIGVSRGMERRYFYKDIAKNTIKYLQEVGSPECIVDDMCDHVKFQDVYDSVIKYWGFGPWMGWKIADMAERVLRYPVDFSDSEMGIYKDPRQGAAFIEFNDKHHPITLDELHACVERMMVEYRNYKAPPQWDRIINEQEIETVLCKYKAHCYGFYPLGNDTYHITKSLQGGCDLAQELAKYVPVFPYRELGLETPKDYMPTVCELRRVSW